MTHVPESLSSRRTMSERALDAFTERGAAPGVQDVFLNSARRERLAVTVHLMTGQSFDARIKGFDRYAVVVDEVRGLLARGVPPHARPFGGLVYRQIMEMLRGVRGEDATRALIVQENRRYARRQLIWFRKEPTLMWFDGPGETLDVRERVAARIAERII